MRYVFSWIFKERWWKFSSSVINSFNFGFNCLEYLQISQGLLDLYLQGNILQQVLQALYCIRFLKFLDLGENLLTNSLTTDFLNSLYLLYGHRLDINGLYNFKMSTFKPVAKLQGLNLAKNQLSKLDYVSFWCEIYMNQILQYDIQYLIIYY